MQAWFTVCNSTMIGQDLKYTTFNADIGWLGILGSAKGLMRITLPQHSAQDARQLLGDAVSCATWSPQSFVVRRWPQVPRECGGPRLSGGEVVRWRLGDELSRAARLYSSALRWRVASWDCGVGALPFPVPSGIIELWPRCETGQTYAAGSC